MGDPTRAAQAQAQAAPATGDQEATDDAATGARGTSFSNHGAVPPVVSLPGTPMMSASDMAFGPAQTYTPPLAKQPDLKARADRLEVERLLESGTVSSGQEAIAALDMMLQMPPDERAKVVDKLDDRAFANLLDRLSEDQRARFAPLIDAASDPKRRLKLWGAQHMGRAQVDLDRYRGDFGKEDEDPTDEQAAAKARFDRRKTGVDSTQHEVQTETDALLAKKDLSIADVDAMRARKDRELDVEMKHNINLVAEEKPRADNTQVQWSSSEVDSRVRGHPRDRSRRRARPSGRVPEVLEGRELARHRSRDARQGGGRFGRAPARRRWRPSRQ